MVLAWISVGGLAPLVGHFFLVYLTVLDKISIMSMKRLQDLGLAGRINLTRFVKTVEEKTGALLDVSR